MKTVKLGVIGCGVIAQQHLKNAANSKLIDVVAVADIREQVAKEVADKFGIKKAYNNPDTLLDDSDIEAVVFALPTFTRREIVLKAFARNKHVLVEKPVAMNVGEIEQMIKARGKLIAGCCCSRMRFLKSTDVVSEFVAGDSLGDLRVLRVRAISPIPKLPSTLPPIWRLKKQQNGGGILVNWGCYDLDYLFGITNWVLKPKLVLAQTWPISSQFESYIPAGSDAETHFAALISCEGGTVITFERGEYVPSQGYGEWEIAGSKGTLHLLMGTDSKSIIFDYATSEQGVVSKVIWEGSSQIEPVTDNNPANDFAAAILDNRSPKTNLEQALIIQKITDAIYLSAKDAIAVPVNTTPDKWEIEGGNNYE